MTIDKTIHFEFYERGGNNGKFIISAPPVEEQFEASITLEHVDSSDIAEKSNDFQIELTHGEATAIIAELQNAINVQTEAKAKKPVNLR